jgi:hypothetical protein
MKPLSFSLSGFALLGVMSVADVNTSCYYDSAHLAMHQARGPVQNAANLSGEDKGTFKVITHDLIAGQLGQAKSFSGIGRAMRDLTSLGRCWQRGRDNGLDENIASICTAFAGPR